MKKLALIALSAFLFSFTPKPTLVGHLCWNKITNTWEWIYAVGTILLPGAK